MTERQVVEQVIGQELLPKRYGSTLIAFPQTPQETLGGLALCITGLYHNKGALTRLVGKIGSQQAFHDLMGSLDAGRVEVEIQEVP